MLEKSKKAVLGVIIFVFISLSGFSNDLSGLWENNDRLVNIVQSQSAKTQLQMALKIYYHYFFDVLSEMSCTINPENEADIFDISIAFEGSKQQTHNRLFIADNRLFTSFFQKIPLDGQNTTPNNPLYGFWVEEGVREGLRAYPQAAPDFFNAYFFDETGYIAFRYWKDDYEFNAKQALFTAPNGSAKKIPKFLQRRENVYTCITANSRSLLNYEQGTYKISRDQKTHRITLTPTRAGPGAIAVSDLYPHAQMPKIKNTPLTFNTDRSCFALGEAFLQRSTQTDFAAYVKAHNAKRKKPREPDLKLDEIDFFWNELMRIRTKSIKW